ncbi:MAG: mannose-1-phosphate guanylyltransferase/mannose-6-phosphate isomerase, partial [Deltaproteobacteria bacterium]
NMGWSDPGTLYALKEAMQTSPKANVVKGKTFTLQCRDCLVYNQEKNKLLTAVGLDGFIVVNTKDAALVVHKDNALKVKDLVKALERRKLTEFI